MNAFIKDFDCGITNEYLRPTKIFYWAWVGFALFHALFLIYTILFINDDFFTNVVSRWPSILCDAVLLVSVLNDFLAFSIFYPNNFIRRFNRFSIYAACLITLAISFLISLVFLCIFGKSSYVINHQIQVHEYLAQNVNTYTEKLSDLELQTLNPIDRRDLIQNYLFTRTISISGTNFGLIVVVSLLQIFNLSKQYSDDNKIEIDQRNSNQNESQDDSIEISPIGSITLYN